MQRTSVSRSVLTLSSVAVLLVTGASAQEVDPVLIDDVSVAEQETFENVMEHKDFEKKFDSLPYQIRKKTLRGGKQEGVELLTVDNGAMKITVVPVRGMNILEVVAGDVRLGWNSPVKDVVHPKFINLESRGGLGWLEGFNEWMVRCGLEFAGHPGMDKFTTNTGDTAGDDAPLHGKIGQHPGFRPWRSAFEKNPPHRVLHFAVTPLPSV